MNISLRQRIQDTQVEPGSLAIFWIAQAGFVYKTPNHKIIYIDPYLSNCVNRLDGDQLYGFKRLMMTPIEPEEVEADIVLSTHFHMDHLDVDALPVMARNPRIHFIGAPDCQAEYDRLKIPPDRYTILHRGQTLAYEGFQLTGVYADHGDLAPQAIGVLLEVGDIKVWQVGDSAYRPEMWQDIFQMGVDLIVPPINGAFGNLNEVEAARLAQDAHARVAIPCHFGMFAEHGGNPARFLDACKNYAPGVQSMLLGQSELFTYHKEP